MRTRLRPSGRTKQRRKTREEKRREEGREEACDFLEKKSLPTACNPWRADSKNLATYPKDLPKVGLPESKRDVGHVQPLWALRRG